MAALLPAAFYGLRVPGGNYAVEADIEFPAAIRITMAAIDTSDVYEPEEEDDAPKLDSKRSVLKIIRLPYSLDDEDDSEYDSEEEDQLKAILNGELSDSEDESSEDDEVNGGPSDPEKSKKARKEAAAKILKEALANAEDGMAVDGIDSKGKGKGISLADIDDDDEDEEDEDEDDEDDDDEIEEFVLCTLDPENHYQQTLDITIGEKEQVLFKVTGNYAIHLSGNYVVPVDDRSPYDLDEDEEEYDLSPDEDELDLDELDDSEEDELDDLDDPRIMEVDTDEEEAPELVATSKKGKNKRKAESDDEEQIGLDEIIGKSLKSEAQANGETKLSKKQQKKLKNNAGQAVAAAEEKPATESPASKKVQFAKNLEQGPTGSTKKDEKKPAEAAKATSVRKVDGITIDDRKAGKGPAAKKGNKISMRYIGKLQDGKVFDSNKSGKPFSFKLGAGEVIKGWDIGVEGIQAGGERRITVPADKAYGKKSLPGIPANSTLIFDVKCIEIK